MIQGAKGATLRGFETKFHTFMFFDTENIRDNKKRLYILGPAEGRKAALRECESAVAYKMSGNGSLRSWYSSSLRPILCANCILTCALGHAHLATLFCILTCALGGHNGFAGAKATSRAPVTTLTTRAAAGPAARAAGRSGRQLRSCGLPPARFTATHRVATTISAAGCGPPRWHRYVGEHVLCEGMSDNLGAAATRRRHILLSSLPCSPNGHDDG